MNMVRLIEVPVRRSCSRCTHRGVRVRLRFPHPARGACTCDHKNAPASLAARKARELPVSGLFRIASATSLGMLNTRRSFLRTAASLASLAALPLNLRTALAGNTPSHNGSLANVEHVVIFMQENRSFDHYFGMLRGVRGFSDPRAIRLPSGKPVWYQPKGDSFFTPFHLDAHKTSAQCASSLDHSWKGSFDRWKDHDAWVETKTRMTMGYFTRRDIPFYYALADCFTICDAYHASVFGPTTPNRLHLFSGTSGLTVGDDGYTAVANPSNETNETADIGNDSKSFRGFTWTTYAERLQQAGIWWRVYQEYDNYGDNGLAYFRHFREPHLHRELLNRGRSWVNGSNANNAERSRGEHLVAAFAEDVRQDRLPQVSWMVAPYIMCEHPSAPPGYGESLVSRLLNALASNKYVWSKTVFILNYDENDGLFDHMPPAIPPLRTHMGASTVDMTGEDYHGEPFGLGPRVPMIVISPWTTGGFVNSQVFDHTSVLRFLETRFGVQAPNISPWRRAVAGDLTSVFDFSGEGGLPHFNEARHAMGRADRECKLPRPNWQKEDLPVQEHGQRLSRALPYDLHVTGSWTGNGFVLEFTNRGSAGASFRVSSEIGSRGPWFFTVEAGRTLSYSLPLTDRYDFSVLGPNGFFRRFAGHGDDRIRAEFRAPEIFLRNDGLDTVTVRNAYDANWSTSAGPASELIVPLDLKATANWYDIMLKTSGGFMRQFAGRVEDGRPGLSDPLMG